MHASPPPPHLPISFVLPPLLRMYIHVGLASIWRRRCKTLLSLRELDSQGTVFFFLGVLPRLAIELDQLCSGKTFTPHKGDDRIT